MVIRLNLLADSETAATSPRKGNPAIGTSVGPITKTSTPVSQSTGEALLEIRLRSGLTWEMLGELFNVSRRTVHHWASGKAPSASHEHRIRRTLDVIRHLDEGTQRTTRARLLTIEKDRSLFELLAESRYGDAMRQAAVSGSEAATGTIADLSVKRPAFAYVPSMAKHTLIADLDRVMTVEKAVLASWPRIPGCLTDGECRAFSQAIARKRSRFAFPDDFVCAASNFRQKMLGKYKRNTDEGRHLRALREIQICGKPSWNDGNVGLTIWFIKDRDLEGVNPDWDSHIQDWVALFDVSGRFRIDAAIACRLEDITARDYVESDQLDLDSLSVDRIQR